MSTPVTNSTTSSSPTSTNTTTPQKPKGFTTVQKTAIVYGQKMQYTVQYYNGQKIAVAITNPTTY